MKINLKNCKKMQTLYGWGTSACWWSQHCRDNDTQNEIIDLLYGSDGLNLNIYRYNIGGGTDEENCRVADPWRKSESFMLYDIDTEATAWDFSRDKAAVQVMKKALATGNVDTLILFANSPHYSQTSTGQASGSLMPHTCNLPKMNYEKFVDYILRVTQHFLDEGLPVKYISPINEPQWCWGGKRVWQEGCHYEAEEVAEIYHLFAENIIKRKMPVKLYGPESGEMLGETYKYIELLSADDTIMQVMDIFAYHSYHSDNKPEVRYTFKKDFVEKYPQFRFDMSEWCELPNKSHTQNFKGALITARIIGQDLIYGGAESWTSWVAVNGMGSNTDNDDYCDATISANQNFTKWYICKRYYGFAHFSKYVPKGSCALDIGEHPTEDNNDFNIFAFERPDGKIAVVIVNEGENKCIELEGHFENMQIIKSTQDYELLKVYDGNFEKSLESESNSIMTIVLS